MSMIDGVNPEEMQMFGFDPQDEADIVEWTTKTEPTTTEFDTPYDYAEDRFEFDGLSSDQDASPSSGN